MINNKKVMLIDDHDISLFVTQHLLKKAGYSANSILLPSGYSALEFISSNLEKIDNLPDIILLDVEMPIVDGWNFIEKFQNIKPKIGKKINIYILTGYDSRVKNQQFLNDGLIENYFTKPLKINDVMEIFK